MKANCTKCENVNEVKIATGYKKPENKGKKYFTCANCGEFQWVQETTTKDSPEATIREKLSQKEEVGWDSIARGKVKHGVVVAIIEHGGLEALKGQQKKIERIVDYIMDSSPQQTEGDEF